jgi:thimet oligopeptidase
VETLFHEFGHIMHQTLTKAKYATFSGTNVKTDYVEAPSQMLENWVWQKEALEKLSGHYKDHSKKLPADLIAKMVRAKNLNAGIKYLRQVAFATIDMTYHTSSKVDSTAVYLKLMQDIMLIPVQEGTEPQASFGHLMGGYDAGYYGYLWSEVYAQDMFTRFEKDGLLSPKVGADYRHWILEPGGQKEPAELIKGFIGREPNEQAFLKKLGLTGN